MRKWESERKRERKKARHKKCSCEKIKEKAKKVEDGDGRTTTTTSKLNSIEKKWNVGHNDEGGSSSQLVVAVLGDVADPRQSLVAGLLDDLQVADLRQHEKHLGKG